MEMVTLPSEAAYWVVPSLLLAGEHPGLDRGYQAQLVITTLVRLGIIHFIDLTEATEAREYNEVLQTLDASTIYTTSLYHRLSITDRSIPSIERMQTILNTIDAAHQQRAGVYVHCHAGIGRTGTVIGCYLARHGLSRNNRLRTITRLRRHTALNFMKAPETEQQRQFVRDWPVGY